MSKILVVAEQRDNHIKDASFEVATLAQSLSSDVTALVIGSAISDEAKRFGQFGVSNVLTVEKPEFANYSPDGYAAAIATVAKNEAATVILLPASAMGKDLSGRIGEKLSAAVAQDCIRVNEDFTAVRPMYAGKVLTTVQLETDVKIYTIRANSVKAEEKAVDANIKTADVAVDFLTVVKEIMTAAGKKIDVAEANIIVTGGRGMGGPENWNLIEDLAATLGAATGASRAVVDAGWRPHAEQVGQTGKTVSPSLYIACGVSGAIQHLAGMKTSKFIVAINKDPEAPIFKVADFGIVGDVMDVLPALNTEFKKIL
jgi:electron transfer flavoprotein alpha subunit